VVVSQADHAPIRAGVERRLDAVESLIPVRPPWRAAGDLDIRPAAVRVVAGPVLRGRTIGSRRFGLLLAVAAIVGLLLAYGLLGGGGLLKPVPTPTAVTGPLVQTSLQPRIEPRLTIPLRPRSTWTVVEDSADVLGLISFLEGTGSGGYHVGLLVIEPHGVYDPVLEDPLLPLPADLMAWIRDHPDLDSAAPVELTVAGLPATAIDVTVTYRSDGPKGQTAQFMDMGVGPLNLEYPSRKRIVLVELPDRPLLIVFDSRPEFFDPKIRAFEDFLRLLEFEEGGPAP
jgi:hypothetical protein